MSFFGDIYLSFGITVSLSSVFKCSSFEYSSFGDFETLVVLSAILLQIKSPASSAVFWIILFEAVSSLVSIEYLIFILVVLFNY